MKSTLKWAAMLLCLPAVLGQTTNYGLTGFASGGNGGGVIAETDARYRKVTNAQGLYDALSNKSIKVIEIMNDLNLGWNEIPAGIKGNLFANHNEPRTHPKLLSTGVTKIYVQDRNRASGNAGLTIFSDRGVTLRHANFILKRLDDIVVRNLKFDELWEWDETTNGDYDSRDWDHITIEDCTGVWLDHLEFSKVYDGVVDIRRNTTTVSVSWSISRGAGNGTNTFYRQQFDHMEANRNSFPKYNYLRGLGISKNDIMQITSPQKKGMLVGPSELDPANNGLRLTSYNNVFVELCDRMPRLRAGNAHLFNIVADFRLGQAAKTRRSALPATPSYKFDVTSNGVISTENGAVMIENARLLEITNPMRNNQKSATDNRYTGKMEARNTYYTHKGTTFTGTSTSTNSPLRPEPGTVLSFSWNGMSSLPYSYSSYLRALNDLELALLGPAGAGAKNLGWSKDNWLKTRY